MKTVQAIVVVLVAALSITVLARGAAPVVPAPAAAGTALTAVKTVDLGALKGKIDHLALDSKTGRLFVAASGSNAVVVADVQGGKVIHVIADVPGPEGIVAMGPGKIAVACAGDGSCRIFDADSYQMLKSVDLKADADIIRYDPAADRLWVTHKGGVLSLIDPEQGKVLADIDVGGKLEAMSLEAKSSRLFINVASAHSVAVIDRRKNAVASTWAMEGATSNYTMALDEANGRLFVGCRKPAKVVVLDTATGKKVAEADCAGDTDDLFYDAANKRIYVSGGAGAVTVIEQVDADHYKSLDQVPTGPKARTSLLAGQTYYVVVPAGKSGKAELRVYQVSTGGAPAADAHAPAGK